MPALFFVVFIDLIGFGMVIPLLPLLGEAVGATPWDVGLLMASFSAAQFVAAIDSVGLVTQASLAPWPASGACASWTSSSASSSTCWAATCT